MECRWQLRPCGQPAAAETGLTCGFDATGTVAKIPLTVRRTVVSVRTVPWWGVASAVIAPAALISGWSIAGELQPGSFDALSRSISTLAAYGAADRWVMTLALIVVSGCNAITGLGLLPAARYGRILLIAGGIFGLAVAFSPQPIAGSSLRHEIAAGLSCAAMTAWPLFGLRREPWTPFGLRPAPSIWATVVVTVILAWFCAEVVTGGDLIGLAERTLTGAQTVWVLLVVLTVVGARWRRSAVVQLPVQHARGPAEESAAESGIAAARSRPGR